MGELVLAVCTGNICRSPFVERMLAALVPPGRFTFASAGTHAMAGSGIELYMADCIERLGGNADDFAAQPLTEQLVSRAALVVALERSHRSAVVQLAPAALRYTVTLREVARIGPLLPARPRTGRQLAAALIESRGLALVRDPTDDDVPDPFGASRRRYDRVADTMYGPVQELARLLR